MTLWRKVPLGDTAIVKGLIGGPFGSSLGGKDYVECGVPVIRGTNLNRGRELGGDYVFVSETKVSRDLARNIAQPGDLVFTQRGTLGQVAVVPPGPYLRYVVSQSQMRLRVDPKVASSDFLYYACSSPGFLQQVNNNAISTGVPHINLGILARLEVPNPTISDQCAIAEILGALDDKIAANVKLVETSDTLARAIFDRMLDDSESIPLIDVAQFINGKAFTNGATGTGRIVIRIAELNSGIGGSTVYNDIDVADEHVARPGDLLFAWSGSLTLHRWFRPEAIVNQHIFKVIPSTGYPVWCSYGLIARKLDAFKAIAAGKATTMGHIQRRHLEEPVKAPPKSVIEHYNSLMTALWNHALLAEQESLLLASTRDALLPQLMSGKIRVKDAEKTVEEVL